jgi:hypothetical protein
MPAPVTVDAHSGRFGSGVLAASSSRISSLGSIEWVRLARSKA